MTPPDGYRPVYHPAGWDHELRVVVEDVRAGRWVAMRRLLADTGTDWELRTSRTQVLAVVAADTDVVRAWRAEDPGSPDAMLMRARIAVERALHARREDSLYARQARAEAHQACIDAARILPNDPVPWVCLLALAQLDPDQLLPQHQHPPPEAILPHGPWGIVREVHRRHGDNREAAHRMWQFLRVRAGAGPGDCVSLGHWINSRPGAELGSCTLLLHIYARQQGPDASAPLARHLWQRATVRAEAHRALALMDATEPRRRALSDLSHLAYALWAACDYVQAARVFTALGTYMTSLPWAYLAADPDQKAAAEQEFLRARGQCLTAYCGQRPRPRPSLTPRGRHRHA